MLTAQEKTQLKQQIQSNKHEIFVISIEEMDAIVKSSPKGSSASVQQAWREIKGKAEFAANHSPTADDLRTIGKLVGDLGGFGAKAYVKTYGGKPHIILTGHAGLRTILTGTKYGIKNPKVVTMGLGKAGAIHAAKSGGILSIVLLSTYRVVDYFLTDQVTLSQLIGSLATDVVKIGIATGASIAAASAVVAAGFTIAIGPILAVVIVGVAVSWVLGAVDQRYGITDRLIDGLDELGSGANAYMQQKRRQLASTANRAVGSVIDYAIDSAKATLVNVARRYLNKYLPIRPRIY